MKLRYELQFSTRVSDCLLLVSSVVVVTCCIVATASSWHWPLVGDAALMRYVVLLLDAGRHPYTQIVDINLPGSYFLEAAAMRLFGAGAIGLRLYDGALCLAVCVCAVVLSERSWRARVCAGVAGLVFWLIHLQDGVVQGGQRDLAMAAFVLIAYVALAAGRWGLSLWSICVFELIVGLTVTIKPTMLLLALLPIYALRLQGEPWGRALGRALSCGVFLAVGPLVTAGWLVRRNAVGGFLRAVSLVSGAHASLARKSLGFLLTHAIAPVGVILVCGIGLGASLGAYRDFKTKLLLYGAACGLVSYLVQDKGFPYHRYPFLAIALPLVFGFVARALQASAGTRTWVALALLIATAGFAVRFAWMANSFDRESAFVSALGQDLTQRHAVDGEVQCLDTVGGCIATLYDLRLLQATGYLYDCYAYLGAPDLRASYRTALLQALLSSRPRYLVITSEFCLSAEGNFGRTSTWPELEELLRTQYSDDGLWRAQTPVRWWSRDEVPPSYRIYRRLAETAAAPRN
jgi:hypothetical protein